MSPSSMSDPVEYHPTVSSFGNVCLSASGRASEVPLQRPNSKQCKYYTLMPLTLFLLSCEVCLIDNNALLANAVVDLQ
jgi:hypothetical protein